MRTLIGKMAVMSMAATFGLAWAGEAQEKLSKELAPFAPYVGKTWKGEFASSTKEKPIHDVSRWERALNGRGIRVVHSVNDGQYGGESMIIWDAKKKSLVYWYFTTAGFYTQGTMKHEDGKWIGHETVTGQSNVSEVKSTSQILPDGRLHTKAQYLKDGKWVEGREVFYKEAPEAKVIFK